MRVFGKCMHALCLPVILLFGCFSLTGTAGAGEGHDLIADPGFEQWQMPPEASIRWEDTHAVLNVQSQTAISSFAVSSFLVPVQAKRLRVEADVHVSGGKQGENTWDKPRIHLTFHDRLNAQLGGWPDVGMWAGDLDWFSTSKTFSLPKGTTSVRVSAGLHNCAGSVSFRGIRAYALDESGQTLPPLPSTSTNDTTDWYAWIAESTADDKGKPATDMSVILDKPAGKHGFVRAVNGKLVFEDGSRARFLGVNIAAGSCFPDRETAKRTADRLAAMGVNIVRLHHMDAAWAQPNIFGNGYSTLELSKTSLDSLDYFIAQLKARGIYIFLDLLVHRVFTEADGVEQAPEAGAKIVGQFDTKLMALQKRYATQLFSHKNPYTKLKYSDEPAIALVDIINESSLFWVHEIPDSYRVELAAKWNRWLAARYGSKERLAVAWSKTGGTLTLLGQKEDPLAGTVLPSSMTAADDSRRRDYLRFLYEKQNGYYQDIRKHLRSIGVKVPVAGSNHWERTALDVASNARMDFVDQHGYWDHPQGGYGSDVTFTNTPMFTSLGGLVHGLLTKRVAGLPYTITEWQNSWPNEYRADVMLAVTAYSAMHDVDALVQFDYSGDGWSDEISGNFNVANKPELMAQWPLVALAFHRGDIASGTGLIAQISEVSMLKGTTVDEVFPDYSPLVDKTELQVFASADKRISRTDVKDYVGAKSAKSRTGQLAWDAGAGTITLDTQRAKGAVGFVGEAGKPIELSGVSLDISTPFACILAVSLDGKPIGESTHLLMSAVARAENTGTVYNAARSRLVSVGTGPILMEPVVGTVKMKRSDGEVKSARVYVLDAQGRRKGLADCTAADGFIVLSLRAQDRSPWYEMVLGEGHN